ncbi:MAG: HlyD family efflux transporter periplasmic adaptor subunit, partial [Thermoanaerobaculia bacterium]
LTLRAPAAGRVDALPFEPGERPRAGDPVIVLLADGAPYARVYVPAAVRPRVDLGSAARVHVDGYAEPFAGEVRRIASEASFTPFFALTERDRGRLVWIAEITLSGDQARRLPTGLPVEATFPALDTGAVAGATDAEAAP